MEIGDHLTFKRRISLSIPESFDVLLRRLFNHFQMLLLLEIGGLITLTFQICDI